VLRAFLSLLLIRLPLVLTIPRSFSFLLLYNDNQAGNFTTAPFIDASLCSQQCNDAPTFSCGGSNALDLYLASSLTTVPTTVPTRVQLDGSGDHTLSTEIGLPTPPPAAEEFKRRQRRSLQQL
jgi:hypothetical protein